MTKEAKAKALREARERVREALIAAAARKWERANARALEELLEALARAAVAAALEAKAEEQDG